MDEFIRTMNARTEACGCGNPHHRVDMHCVIGEGAIRQVKQYVSDKGWSQVTIAVDVNTLAAAGQSLAEDLKAAGIDVTICEFTQDERGDVLADAPAVLQLLLQVSDRTDAIVAAGSGTIHDIVRFAASKTNKPFLSVPTAASVDGFTSAGAPLIIQGVKKTIQTKAPDAIFADLDILSQAPQTLTAAGYADMLGKYTSLADWQVSKAMADEPFCPVAYEITRQALDKCVGATEEIAKGSKSGLKTLMEALIESGLSMLAVDHSRPASGGEHHVSHMWEMQCIQNELKQLLHGAKVGVASVMLSGLYRRLAESGHGDGMFDVYKELPEQNTMADYLRKVGGPKTPEELDISSARVLQALQEGPDLRDRATGLRYIRDHLPEWLKAMA